MATTCGWRAPGQCQAKTLSSPVIKSRAVPDGCLRQGKIPVHQPLFGGRSLEKGGSVVPSRNSTCSRNQVGSALPVNQVTSQTQSTPISIPSLKIQSQESVRVAWSPPRSPCSLESPGSTFDSEDAESSTMSTPEDSISSTPEDTSPSTRVNPLLAAAPQAAWTDSSDPVLGTSGAGEAPPHGGLNGASQVSNIRVAVRVRPTSHIEDDNIEVPDEHTIKITKSAATGGNGFLASQQGRTEERWFDRVFGPKAEQADVYMWSCQPLIHAAVSEGRNATFFVYGATGAGKTHTMFGERDEALQGMIFRAVRDVFKCIGTNMNLVVKVSFLELYNEMVRDLLQESGGGGNCKILEDERRGYVKVANLKQVPVTTSAEAVKQLRAGMQSRKVESTAANSRSSRSHAVFTLTLERNEPVSSTGLAAEEERLHSRICLIDLAGSERASHTHNVGAALKDGASINLSLLALANCIDALGERSRSGANATTRKPPYRDSKLTLLLKASLLSNALVSMIANVHPGRIHFEDTNNTLEYAKRASAVKREVIVKFQRPMPRLSATPPLMSRPTSVPTKMSHEVSHVSRTLERNSGTSNSADQLRRRPNPLCGGRVYNCTEQLRRRAATLPTGRQGIRPCTISDDCMCAGQECEEIFSGVVTDNLNDIQNQMCDIHNFQEQRRRSNTGEDCVVGPLSLAASPLPKLDGCELPTLDTPSFGLEDTSQLTTPRRTLSCSAEMLLNLVSSTAEIEERQPSMHRAPSADIVQGATERQEMASTSQPTTPRRTLSCSAEMLLDLVSTPAEMAERKRSRSTQRVASAGRLWRGAIDFQNMLEQKRNMPLASADRVAISAVDAQDMAEWKRNVASADGVARGATDAQMSNAGSLLMSADCAALPSVRDGLLAEPSTNAVTLLLRIIDSLRSEKVALDMQLRASEAECSRLRSANLEKDLQLALLLSHAGDRNTTGNILG